MPIRINLLAEAQAMEEMRRKDPVKRAFVVSASLVMAFLAWSAVLQLRIIAGNAVLHGLEAKWQAMEEDFKTAEQSQTALIEAERKLNALEELHTNRFLWGSALNALQQTMRGVDAIQVVHLKTEQQFHIQEATKPRTNENVVIPAKPATSTEKISILIEATDGSKQPGDQVNRYKQAILSVPYFQEKLQKTNGVLLTSLSPPVVDQDSGKSFVKFTLQCLFPEKVR